MPSAETQIHETASIASGATVGAGTRIWQHCILLDGARVGRNCKLGHNVFVEGGARIGHGVTIKDNVVLYDGVDVGDEAFIGPNVVFTNVLTPRAFIPRPREFARTVVGRGATLGANATILCGVEIGGYALVAAGSVVTKSVTDYALVRGNPARHVGWVSRAGRVLGPGLVCPDTGETYIQSDGHLIPSDLGSVESD
jgi:UDP-2-acetamido-3-amino-2,3-dideoxy-glucuronate N-acetyltransferase